MRTRSKSAAQPEEKEAGRKRKAPSPQFAKQSASDVTMTESKRGRRGQARIVASCQEDITPKVAQRGTKQRTRRAKAHNLKELEKEEDLQPSVAQNLEKRLAREPKRGINSGNLHEMEKAEVTADDGEKELIEIEPQELPTSAGSAAETIDNQSDQEMRTVRLGKESVVHEEEDLQQPNESGGGRLQTAIEYEGGHLEAAEDTDGGGLQACKELEAGDSQTAKDSEGEYLQAFNAADGKDPEAIIESDTAIESVKYIKPQQVLCSAHSIAETSDAKPAEGLIAGTPQAPTDDEDAFWGAVIAMEEEREAAAGSSSLTPQPKVVHKQEDAQGSLLQEVKLKVRPSDLDRKVWVNRAPVLTLWVAVVAERQGYTFNEGLTFGKAVAGMFAHSKGRRLGIYGDEDNHETKISSREKFQVFGLNVRGQHTKGGIRALDEHGRPIEPSSVEKYLERSFVKFNLDASKAVLEMLAHSYSPEEIGDVAYRLYEEFRPSIPEGVHGWGAKGVLDLRVVSSLVQ